MTFGIQKSWFRQKIFAGRLNKAGTEFLEKQEVTNAALFAVAEYVKATEHGAVEITSGDNTYHIEVKIMPSKEAA